MGDATTFIYGLCDPRTGYLRYVGKANSPRVRLYRHHCVGPQKNHRHDWLLNLKKNGLKPEMFIVEEVPVDQWEEAERFWICYFRSIGCPLVNATGGGDGVSNVTDETRAKLRAIALSRPKPSLATRLKMSKSLKGKPGPWKGKVHPSRGKKRSSEFREMRRKMRTGKKASASTLIKQRQVFYESVNTAEYREKMSSSIKEWWRKRKEAKKQIDSALHSPQAAVASADNNKHHQQQTASPQT